MIETSNMRRGFTMIELIFVIVIIGILAAVAIPKLAATRDDAVAAKTCANIATCVTDLAAEYTAVGTSTLATSVACSDTTVSGLLTLVDEVSIAVAGAPTMCSNLDVTTAFGGSRVSF